ncbi:MAG: phage virion morphogenesis protein [Chitinophagaceae bacterium]
MASDNIPAVFKNLRGKMKTAIQTLPKVLGNEAVNWSKESFNRQGFLNESLQPWQARKKSKGRNMNKAILIQSGRLRRSIRVISSTENTVVIGTDVPYARIHNYGGTITQAARSETFIRNRRGTGRGINKYKFKRGTTPGRGFSYKARVTNMPQRKFMGNSANLRLRLFIVGRNHLAQKLK